MSNTNTYDLIEVDICAVVGCGGSLRKGHTSHTLYCDKHHKRMVRRGTTDSREEQRQRWVAAALAADTDECIDWPGSLSMGYGKHGSERAHVVVCTAAHGPRPKGYEAAHQCHRRICINPQHLRWEPKEYNIRASAKLSSADTAAIIQARAAGVGVIELAERNGVHNSTISRAARLLTQPSSTKGTSRHV